jgi:hypothetical protein
MNFISSNCNTLSIIFGDNDNFLYSLIGVTSNSLLSLIDDSLAPSGGGASPIIRWTQSLIGSDTTSHHTMTFKNLSTTFNQICVGGGSTIYSFWIILHSNISPY